MNTEVIELKRCNVIKLSGRFDSNTAPALEQAFRQCTDAGVYHIVVDMSGVEFFSSAAIRILIMAYKECRRWNRGDVRLAAVPERIVQVLDLAGILSFIETYPDTTLAVGSY
jgi:anti-sigma B factor antagonist